MGDARMVVIGKLALASALVATGFVVAACGVGPAGPITAQQLVAKTWWRPKVGVKWQWQLEGKVSTTVNVPVYDIDLFTSSKKLVSSLHAKHRRVICYVDVGSWEDFRSDAKSFPASLLGHSNGWSGERWLDVRKISVLGPIMAKRLDQCKAKGFDAVEPDNVDGYANDTGFPITAAQQLKFNRYIARLAHARGLGVALKNDPDQAKQLVKDFDFALSEQCFEYDECDLYNPFIKAGKAVFEVEYNLPTSRFCTKARQMHFSSMRKRLLVATWRQGC
jgi:hypothetical protein